MDDNKEQTVDIEEVSLNDVAAPDAGATDRGATNDNADAGADATPDGGPDADCGKQIDALTAEVKELNDKYLRAVAELENTRRRAARDCESAVRNRAMSVVRNFLPVMDAVESALNHNPDDAGIQAMARAMSAALEQTGVKKIDSAAGVALNPMHHNAIQVVENQDAAPNTIVQEMQPGYMFDDTVLRTAMVVVAK